MPAAPMIDFSIPAMEPMYRTSAPRAEASSINGSRGTTCPAEPPPVNANFLPANVCPWSCVTIQLVQKGKRVLGRTKLPRLIVGYYGSNEHCPRQTRPQL